MLVFLKSDNRRNFFIRVRFCDNDNQWGSYYTFTIEIIDCKRYYYVKDHLGNIRQTVDENGVIISAQDYSPYGEIIRSYNNADANDKYKFTEKERDKETNLDYFGARYYDAGIGRWLNIDPLSDLYPGINPYNYVMNNPLNLIDPTGMAAASAARSRNYDREEMFELQWAYGLGMEGEAWQIYTENKYEGEKSKGDPEKKRITKKNGEKVNWDDVKEYDKSNNYSSRRRTKYILNNTESQKLISQLSGYASNLGYSSAGTGAAGFFLGLKFVPVGTFLGGLSLAIGIPALQLGHQCSIANDAFINLQETEGDDVGLYVIRSEETRIPVGVGLAPTSSITYELYSNKSGKYLATIMF